MYSSPFSVFFCAASGGDGRVVLMSLLTPLYFIFGVCQINFFYVILFFFACLFPCWSGASKHAALLLCRVGATLLKPFAYDFLSLFS